MSEKDLIPIKKGQTDIPRLGGKAKSPQKKYAAKIREMKKKAAKGRISQKEVNWFIARMEDPEANIIDINNYLDSVKGECKNANQKILLAQTQIQLHKAHFGEKHHNTNYNFNINLDNYIDKLYKMRRNDN